MIAYQRKLNPYSPWGGSEKFFLLSGIDNQLQHEGLLNKNGMTIALFHIYHRFEEPRFSSYINIDDSIDAYEEQIISMTNGHKKNLVPHETLCLSKLR